MDEPSAALSEHETRQLHEIIRALARGGTSILLISHFLREVLELADSVTVLRDGEVVRTAASAQETESSLIEAMLGRPLTSTFPPKQLAAGRRARPALGARALALPAWRMRRSTSRAGEILGVAGLVGAGRTELARALYGAARVQSGTAQLDVRRGARPQSAPQPRRGPRDDPRVAQGRRADLRALRRRERDALAARGRQRVRRRAPRARAQDGARRARSLRRARRAATRRRCARSREATSRRCCSRGRSCAARA